LTIFLTISFRTQNINQIAKYTSKEQDKKLTWKPKLGKYFEITYITIVFIKIADKILFRIIVLH